MIWRQWRGVVKSDRADAYVEHLQTETFPSLRRVPGFMSASILRRSIAGGTEFLIVTQWASLQSIGSFAGDDIEKAVVPHKAREMMVEFDEIARHYEIVE